MNFYGLSVAAFKLPIYVPTEDILDECKALEDTFLPHNMQLGKTEWSTGAIKAALGKWQLSDPAFYRHLPEMQPVSGNNLADRLEYMKRWAYTEVACHAPATTRFCREVEALGSFMTGARYLKVGGESFIKYHFDNNPGKEFRVTVGLEGIENEEFTINNGHNNFTRIPMKAGEAWFIDISFGHAIVNRSKKPRYRLGMQFYGPPSDGFLSMFRKCDQDSIIYAKQLRVNPLFEDS